MESRRGAELLLGCSYYWEARRGAGCSYYWEAERLEQHERCSLEGGIRDRSNSERSCGADSFDERSCGTDGSVGQKSVVVCAATTPTTAYGQLLHTRVGDSRPAEEEEHYTTGFPRPAEDGGGGYVSTKFLGFLGRRRTELEAMCRQNFWVSSAGGGRRRRLCCVLDVCETKFVRPAGEEELCTIGLCNNTSWFM